MTTAVDVYGLGAVLYKLLDRPAAVSGRVGLRTPCGRFGNKSRSPPATGASRSIATLEAICLKCLEKDPRRRYRSAEVVAADLDRWLTGEPIAARPIGPMRARLAMVRPQSGRRRIVGERGGSCSSWSRPSPRSAAFHQRTLAGVARSAASREKAAADSEREARLLADARAREIRWRLVRMNVENGVRIVDQGDHTGALPWFAEALRLDRDDPMRQRRTASGWELS